MKTATVCLSLCDIFSPIEINDAELRKTTHSLLIRLSLCRSIHRLLSAGLICAGALELLVRDDHNKNAAQAHISLTKSSSLPGYRAFNRIAVQWLTHSL